MLFAILSVRLQHKEVAVSDSDPATELRGMVDPLLLPTTNIRPICLDAVRRADWGIVVREHILRRSREQEKVDLVEREVVGGECDTDLHQHRDNNGHVNCAAANQHGLQAPMIIVNSGLALECWIFICIRDLVVL